MIERSHAQTISVDLVIEFYYMLMKVSDVKRLGVLGWAIRQDHMLGNLVTSVSAILSVRI